MDLSHRLSTLSKPRPVLLGLSFVSLVVCTGGAIAHYLRWAWGNPWQPVGWLFSILFLLLAFCPPPRQIAVGLRSLIKPKTVVFIFWITVFIVSHLWNFSTSPWNGNGLYDDSAVDLWFLKGYVIGHPFQAAWVHVEDLISRETLFHYYVWAFFGLFGYNLLSYQAALFVIWCVTFVFTLLLVDLLFSSNIVTSIAALVFNFLPFAFIYTFAGYRYMMTTALCVGSLYFLHLGFKKASPFCLSLGGLVAGLCQATSLAGKQYLYGLFLFLLLYAGFHWKTFKKSIKWGSVSVLIYSFAVAVMPLVCFIVFNYGQYKFYEGAMFDQFWQALRGGASYMGLDPNPHDLRWFATQFWKHVFVVPGPRRLFPNALPLPMPYYLFWLPGIILAIRNRRYELAFMAIIPMAAAFASGAGEHRLLLASPFWIILMAFTFAWLLGLKLPLGFRISLWTASALILMWGFVPSVQYVYQLTRDPFSIGYFNQDHVAVARFLRDVVAGRKPSNPPRLERDEFNRVEGIPDPSYDTLICQNGAFSVIHLFLFDYDDKKILSFCGGYPTVVESDQDVWTHNKTALAKYVPQGRDLKLMWEIDRSDPRMDKIIKLYEPLRDLTTDESIPFSFGFHESTFYALNISSKNISQFQERIRNLPDSLTPTAKPPPTETASPTPKPAPPSAAGGWTFCADENQQCKFTGTKQVRYGANDVYHYGTFTDGVLCANSIFGDPIRIAKHCDCANTPSTTPAPR